MIVHVTRMGCGCYNDVMLNTANVSEIEPYVPSRGSAIVKMASGNSYHIDGGSYMDLMEKLRGEYDERRV